MTWNLFCTMDLCITSPYLQLTVFCSKTATCIPFTVARIKIFSFFWHVFWPFSPSVFVVLEVETLEQKNHWGLSCSCLAVGTALRERGLTFSMIVNKHSHWRHVSLDVVKDLFQLVSLFQWCLFYYTEVWSLFKWQSSWPNKHQNQDLSQGRSSWNKQTQP